tara:strand:- start:576 stop:734 length:159 start_codon:yes stop_codon:yes gene_type:complete
MNVVDRKVCLWVGPRVREVWKETEIGKAVGDAESKANKRQAKASRYLAIAQR